MSLVRIRIESWPNRHFGLQRRKLLKRFLLTWWGKLLMESSMRHPDRRQSTPELRPPLRKSWGHPTELFEHDGDSYRLLEVYSGEQRVRTVPFDAVEIESGALWAR
jgi:hypothetical protein